MIDGHRTICNVLEEIRSRAQDSGDIAIVNLSIEAKVYAQRMSAKLVEYKREKRERDGRNGSERTP